MRFIFLTVALTFSACGRGSLWEDGQYQVISIDGGYPYMAKCHLEMTCQRITGERIISVGNNERYIVMENKHESGGHSVYFIIDKEVSGYNTEKAIPMSVTGPLDNETFISKKSVLNLPEFSVEF